MKESELESLFRKRPHLVILGAGATMAAIPDGDKNGRKSSVMNNFIKELKFEDVIKDANLKTKSENLEDIYSELYDREDGNIIRQALEIRIKDYFGILELPENPTIYDYLILSLRKKDCIASFNWDDLLIQAYRRVCKITNDLPELAFLHGNISAGICDSCCQYGYIKSHCPKCGNIFNYTPLLYPIRNKDYTSNVFIKEQWEILKDYLSRAAIITIFGYSAPKTDVEAIKILKETFCKLGQNIHQLDRIEIIEKPGFDKQKLSSTWEYFANEVNGHIDIYSSFFQSILSEFPRRSVDGYIKRNITGWWGDSSISFNNDFQTFKDLKLHLLPLFEDERDGIFNVK